MKFKKETNYNLLPIFLIICVICITLIIITYIISNGFTITYNINIDSNTLEAVKSINWSMLK